MKDYVNWAILAPGHVANSMAKAMAECAKTRDNIRLYAVASRSVIRAENFAKQWGFLKFYGDYDKLATDPRVDAVYVANPHALHFDTVMKLLENGKHVLCEKPAGINLDQLLTMIDKSEEKSVFFMEAMWSAFNPTLHKVRQYVNSGKLGKLQHIESKFCKRFEYNKETRIWDPKLGGGALLDLGIYNLFLAMFMNNFTGIEYFSSDVRFKNNVDAWNCVNINFSNKVTTTFQSSIDIPSDSPTYDATIYCSKGFITLKDFHRAEKAEIHKYTDVEGNESTIIKTIEEPFMVNGYEYELLDVNKQILTGYIESDIYTHIQSIYLASVLNDLREQWNFKYPFEK